MYFQNVFKTKTNRPTHSAEQIILIVSTLFKKGPQAGGNLTTYKSLEHATYTTGKLASTQTTVKQNVCSKDTKNQQ